MITRVLIVIGLLTVFATGAHAYLFNWNVGDPHVLYFPEDPNDTSDPARTGTEIEAIWWGLDPDAGMVYFRMDLMTPPLDDNSADIYAIYIDDRNPATGSLPGNSFVPTELSRIDFVLSSQWNQIDDFNPPVLRYWNGSGWSSGAATLLFADNENGGRTLEWGINATALPGEFMFWGGTIDVGGGPPVTWDLATGGVTPEPTTLALLGVGLGGLWLRRRKSAA